MSIENSTASVGIIGRTDFVLLTLLLVAFYSPAFAEQSPITIRFATANPEGSHYVEHLYKFKTLVEQYSDGKIVVEPIIDGQYGSEHDNVMGTAEGDIHMTTVAVNNLAPFAPVASLLSLPYLFDNPHQARKLFSHPVMDEFDQRIGDTANVATLGWLIGGYRVLTNNKHPVYTPEDLAGLRIRTPMNPIMIATFRSWGIEPLPIAWTDTYQAIKDNIVDGQENPHLTYSNMPKANNDIAQVQKYITDLHYILWTGPHLVNKPFFGSLNEYQKSIIIRAAEEAAMHQWQWTESRNQKQLEQLVKQGMELNSPQQESTQWKNRALAIWPDFLANNGNWNLLFRIQEAIQ